MSDDDFGWCVVGIIGLVFFGLLGRWATRWPDGGEMTHSLFTLGWVVVGVLVLAVLAALSGRDGRGPRGSTHGHFVSGGDKARVALRVHENAHQKVCARVGGGGSTIRIWRDGKGWRGQTTFHDWRKVAALAPEKRIAIDLAGLIAAPDTFSPTDMPHAVEVAQETSNPAAAMREGRRIARRTL